MVVRFPTENAKKPTPKLNIQYGGTPKLDIQFGGTFDVASECPSMASERSQRLSPNTHRSNTKPDFRFGRPTILEEWPESSFIAG